MALVLIIGHNNEIVCKVYKLNYFLLQVERLSICITQNVCV